MQTIHFETKKTARYIQNAKAAESQDYLWFALHGYGQLIPFFARNFSCLNPSIHRVIVPEALSRFYQEGFYGRVGATWMTKEDRETDIKDYVNYLNELSSQILAEHQSSVKIVLLGFSQGAATACRWLNDGQINAKHLVLWSSIFPPDLKMNGFMNEGKAKIWQLMGNEDEFMNEKRWKENENITQQLGLDVEQIAFEGKHKIYDTELLKLAEKLS